MLKLVQPSIKYRDSFIEAVREFQAGSDPTRFRHISGLNISKVENNFEEYLEKIANKEKGIGLEEGWVPASAFWLVEKGEVIGMVSLRHTLNENLLKIGGHIGYGIRPSNRNKGYGTKILELALKEAKKLGIEKVLVSCDDDNIGSIKVIEKNGGILENKIVDERKLKRRYWIENK